MYLLLKMVIFPCYVDFQVGYRSMVPHIIFGTEKTSPNPHAVSIRKHDTVLVGIVSPVFDTIATLILF